MNGNIPIPETPFDIEVWLVACVSHVTPAFTRHGKRYYDAVARNRTGHLPLKCWSETIDKCGELTAGLYGLTGRLSAYQGQAQFVLTAYRPITAEKYRRHQQAEPPFPLAYTWDCETVPLPGYRERALSLAREYLRKRALNEGREAGAREVEAEASRLYAAGSLSAATGRLLSVALHVAPQAEFFAPGMGEEVFVFGIDEGGRERDEAETLAAFISAVGRMTDADEHVLHCASFDLPFVLGRCVAHSLVVPEALRVNPARSASVYDTSSRFCAGSRHHGGKVSLDALAWALRLQTSKTERVSGDKVLGLYEAPAGEREANLKLIREYNREDALLTRRCYERTVRALGR